MWLPTPSQNAVLEFQALAKREFSIELDLGSARRVATQILQIHYLLAYAYRDIRPKVDGE